MKYDNLLINRRSKPRLKLSNRIGYSLVKPSKFRSFKKRKWQKFTRFRGPNTEYNAGFQAGTALKRLYGERLKSKQALRASYGKITERQFKNIIRKSEYGKASSKVSLKGLFERRLDVLVKRLGFAKTIFEARQLVSHKFFKVNGKPVNSPSLTLGVGDYITVGDRLWEKVYRRYCRDLVLYNRILKVEGEKSQGFNNAPVNRSLKKLRRRLLAPTFIEVKGKGGKSKKFHNKSLRFRPVNVPKYMEFDYSTLTAILVSLPNQNEVLYKNTINFKHIREFY